MEKKVKHPAIKVVKHNDGTYWKVGYVKEFYFSKRTKRISFQEYKKGKK